MESMRDQSTNGSFHRVDNIILPNMTFCSAEGLFNLRDERVQYVQTLDHQLLENSRLKHDLECLQEKFKAKEMELESVKKFVGNLPIENNLLSPSSVTSSVTSSAVPSPVLIPMEEISTTSTNNFSYEDNVAEHGEATVIPAVDIDGFENSIPEFSIGLELEEINPTVQLDTALVQQYSTTPSSSSSVLSVSDFALPINEEQNLPATEQLVGVFDQENAYFQCDNGKLEAEINTMFQEFEPTLCNVCGLLLESKHHAETHLCNAYPNSNERNESNKENASEDVEKITIESLLYGSSSPTVWEKRRKSWIARKECERRRDEKEKTCQRNEQRVAKRILLTEPNYVESFERETCLQSFDSTFKQNVHNGINRHVDSETHGHFYHSRETFPDVKGHPYPNPPIPCPHCNRFYKTNGSLEYHIHSVHRSIKKSRQSKRIDLENEA